jgi:beta-carotene 15,15'-dioxygenase
MLRKILLLLGLVLLVCKSYILLIPVEAQFYIFIFGIVLLGIPHGAADMLVAKKQASLTNAVFSSKRFLIDYILRLAIFGVFCYFFPILGLLSFLLFAATHFGETDLQEIKTESFIGSLVVILYGTVILAILLLTHLEEVLPLVTLLNTSTPIELYVPAIAAYKIDIIFSLLILFFISLTIYQSKFKRQLIPMDRILINLSFYYYRCL